MIDHLGTTMELIERLREVVPFPAILPMESRKLLDNGSKKPVPEHATVIGVEYLGDVAGILCILRFEGEEKPSFVSLTHLRFDPHMPLAEAIADYQQRRVENLRKSLN